MNGLFISLAALPVIGLILFLFNRKIDRRLESSALVEQIQHEIDEILIELNGSTERNIGLVEARMKALSALLEQADRKIGVLRGELEKQTRSADTYTDVVSRRRALVREAKPPTDSPSNPEPIVQSSPGGGDDQGPSAPRLRDRVRKLHETGYAPQEIAQKLGSPIGEVELILSLFDREQVRRPSEEEHHDRE